jgi:hypothetical protein
MRIAIDSFRGEAPRVTPRALPPNAAQDATNARLQSGDLEAWRQFAEVQALNNVDPVETIYLLNDVWLSWSSDVDVARGAIAGDESYRIYITGPEEYDEPRYSDYALATQTGTSTYPAVTRPLGVPSPESPPTVDLGEGASPDVTVTDSGDQFTSWTASGSVTTGSVVSDVSQDNAIGFPAPSYKIEAGNNVTAPAFMYRDFGVGNNVVTRFTSQFSTNSNGAVLGAGWAVMNTSLGAGCIVGVGYTQGAAGGLFLVIGTKGSWSDPGSWLEQIPMAALDGSGATVYDCDITFIRNANGTSTVNATVSSGSGQLAQASLTALFSVGGYSGFAEVVGFPLPAIATHYDNIVITGSGAFNDAVTTVATSYVYTFVNDLDQESGPSEASSTVLRPDGISITVTTPTTVPSGISDDYGVETKRIYRSVTGATGTVFRFVAEIPLAQADYVDVLSDEQLGEVLITELWALPPDDMRGILALPNGIMVGFSKNQLCFSAQNYPHAWPVEYRLNTDTAIVGIGNIDNTVVIGTESFPYLATGNDPAAYSMSKLEVPQACVAKRSVAYLTGIGVVFASPDGLLAITGNGQVRNLTSSIFTRRQWQDLAPETLTAVAHDDIYFFWYGEGLRGNYIFQDTFTGTAGTDLEDHTPDIAPDGFGWAVGLNEITLTGSGQARGGTTADGRGNSSGSAPPLDMTLTFPFSIEITATPFTAPVTERALFQIRDTAGDTIWAEVSIGCVDATTFHASFNGHNGNNTEVNYVITNEAHTVRASFDGVTCTVSIDGVAQTPFAFVPPTSVDEIRLWIAAEASGTCLVNDINIQTPPGFPEGDRGGFALDMKPDGFGLVPLSFFTIARYADPITDNLYVVPQTDDEPSDVYLPLPSTAPDVDGFTIYQFDSPDGDGDMVYRWRGKLNLLERPACFQYAQVKAEDYTNLVLKLYGDGVSIFERVITSQREFTLPTLNEYATLEMEVLGTSRVRTVQIGETVMELV